MAKTLLLILHFSFFTNLLNCLYAQELSIEEEEYINNTLQLILENRIDIFDTNYNRIEPLTLRTQFIIQDTIINDVWTRPRFVDNIFYDGFDGVTRLRSFPNFDTIAFKNKDEYIAFREYIYDFQSGNFLGIKTAFIIRKNSVPKSISESKKEFINRIINEQGQSASTKLIGNWENFEIIINDQSYQLDSCLKKYQLELKANFEFEQSFSGDTLCYTVDMQPNIVVGVEGDPIYFYKYSDKVQYCLIENRIGFWATDSKYLIFYTQYGREINKLEIVYLSDDLIELRTNNYQLKMKKIASR